MDEDYLRAQLQQVAIMLGDEVYCRINRPELVGTENESGYLLMMFNVQGHDGRSTVVSSCLDRGELRQLLQFALDNLDGSMVSIVEGGSEH